MGYTWRHNSDDTRYHAGRRTDYLDETLAGGDSPKRLRGSYRQALKNLPADAFEDDEDYMD